MKLATPRRLILPGLAVAVIAGLLSLLAYPFPDALEDSLESHRPETKAAEEAGPRPSSEGSEGWSAPLPDYSVPGVKSEGLGGALAGILGATGTFLALLLLLHVLKGRGRRGPNG